MNLFFSLKDRILKDFALKAIILSDVRPQGITINNNAMYVRIVTPYVWFTLASAGPAL